MSDRLPDFQQTVRQEWIDYNGHMSEAFYVLVFGHATDMMMAETGLGPGYRESSGCSLYTGEAHIRYLKEVEEGAELTVRTRVLGVGAKKLRFSHEMYVGEATGEPVATIELLGVHVSQKEGGSTAFPDEVRERFRELAESETPEWAGRSIRAVA